jgi:hypothetical protein
LFGLGWENAKNTKAATSLDQGEEDEGNAHSGPGGYEGMGYQGGYAAEYFDESNEEH